MRTARTWARNVLIAGVLCGITARGGIPQTPTQQTTTPQSPTSADDKYDPFGNKQQNDTTGAHTPSDIQQRLRDAQETERQKRLVDDTDKLLALATQLHTDVAKTNKNILSVDVINRADQIEKLAHAVKERMKAN